MIDIQHSIDGCTDLLQPTRKFEKDGVLALLKGNSITQIYVFLFNDLVLLAKNVSQVGSYSISTTLVVNQQCLTAFWQVR